MAAAHPDRAACEFFAGMGLVRCALEARGWRVAYANDIDPLKARLYRASFPGDDHFDPRDIHAVAPGDIPPAALWTASFPCTDLSLAGKGAGIHAGQSGAVWGLLSLLSRMPEGRAPRWLLFENVTGLLTSHGGRDLRALVEALNAQGFGVDILRVDARCFTPQSRPRLFLIATRTDDAGAPEAADPHALDACAARPEVVLRAMRAHADLLWHARELPPLPRAGHVFESIVESVPSDSPRWWPRERAEYFLHQMHPGHRARAEAMIRAGDVTRACAFRRIRPVGEGGAKKSVIELRPDALAGCLRTPKGGSAKQILFEAGRGAFRVRHLTATECARLQGAPPPPERFTDNELLFGYGDAVCVPAVEWALGVVEHADNAPLLGVTAPLLAAQPRSSARRARPD